MTKRLSDSKVSSMVISNYIPYGATVTPVDDYTIWLRCAELPNTYGSLANVIADTTAMETLCNNLNALRYMVRSEDVIMPAVLDDTDWVAELDACAYAVTVPTMTSDTTPSGVASASSVRLGLASLKAYKVFDNDDATWWESEQSPTATFPHWVQYEFSNALWVYKFTCKVPAALGGDAFVKTAQLKGSNDGDSFSNLTSVLTFVNSTAMQTLNVNQLDGEYTHIRLDVLSSYYTGSETRIERLQFYGLDLS